MSTLYRPETGRSYNLKIVRLVCPVEDRVAIIRSAEAKPCICTWGHRFQ